MKKILSILVILTSAVSIVACGSRSANISSSAEVVQAGDTIGSKYLAAFANSSSTDVKSVVSELLAIDEAGTELVEMDVSEGYLDGFDADITGFSVGEKFSPMIGSIPFVGYVFEAEDPDALLKQLKDNANPAWNICTEADETVSYIRGNLVFFLMCSNEE